MEEDRPQGDVYEFQAYLLGIELPEGFKDLLKQYVLQCNNQVTIAEHLASMFTKAGCTTDDVASFMESLQDFFENFIEERVPDAPETEIQKLSESLFFRLSRELLQRYR